MHRLTSMIRRASLAGTIAIIASTAIVGVAVTSSTPEPSPDATSQVGLSIDCDAFEAQPLQEARVEVPSGDDLVMTLCSNPSTGYAWSDPVVADSAILLVTGATAEPAISPLPGAAGTQSWTFRAGQPGSTMVALSYDQPWDGGETGAWRVSVEVVVR
jgi:predicted secreted protein